MSDYDIEVDEGDSDSRHEFNNTQYFSQAEKRAHHNALERNRRDHIKDSFSDLRDTIPALQNEKVASRVRILNKATEYIQQMHQISSSDQQDVEKLKRQNKMLEEQIETLENRIYGANSHGEQ